MIGKEIDDGGDEDRTAEKAWSAGGQKIDVGYLIENLQGFLFK